MPDTWAAGQLNKKFYTGGSENACHRKRPEHYNHIWSYDFLSERLENGRLVKWLVVIDEFTREYLAIDVNRKIKSPDVVEVLRYLFAVRGEPEFITPFDSAIFPTLFRPRRPIIELKSVISSDFLHAGNHLDAWPKGLKFAFADRTRAVGFVH